MTNLSYELRELIAEVTGLTEVYRMDELDMIFEGAEPTEIVNRIFYGGNNFNPNHGYFAFDGYANIKSISSYEYEDMFNEEIECNKDVIIEEIEHRYGEESEIMDEFIELI